MGVLLILRRARTGEPTGSSVPSSSAIPSAPAFLPRPVSAPYVASRNLTRIGLPVLFLVWTPLTIT